MKPVQQRFHDEFRAAPGGKLYQGGMTLLEARNAAGSTNSKGWTPGAFNVSRRDDEIAALSSQLGELAAAGERIRVAPSNDGRRHTRVGGVRTSRVLPRHVSRLLRP